MWLRKMIRPCIVIPALAFTVNYPSAASLFHHVVLGFAGGLLVEALAIDIARREKKRNAH